MLNPKIIVQARGAKNQSLVRVASPITVVSVVLKIGLSLDFALSFMAWSLLSPCLQFSFAVSIRMIALFTTIPVSAINQIKNSIP